MIRSTRWWIGLAVVTSAACSLHVDYTAGAAGDGGAAAPAPDCTIAIGAGLHHTCAILSDGTAACWGSNSAGQLGNGDPAFADSDKPVAVVTAGLPTLTTIDSGAEHTCALASDHTVWCWGGNADFQLGNQKNGSNVPTRVEGITQATALAVGSHHTCVLDGSSVKCWGKNDQGQLGTGMTSKNSSTPTRASLGSDVAISIAAGLDETCAIVTPGTVKCWGANESGEIGNAARAASVPTPTEMSPSIGNATQVAVGNRFACVLTSDGNVLCTGSNRDNEIRPYRNGSTDADHSVDQELSPLRIPLDVGVKSIVAGDRFACAVDGTQQLWCWGNNDDFQLTDGGGSAHRMSPVRLEYRDAQLVAAGTSFLCVKASDGLHCAGFNGFGQLGNGEHTTDSTPLAVADLTGVTALTTGSSFSCAITSDATAKCWGENDLGQLGDGSAIARLRPVAVIGLHDVQKLVSNQRHSCALLADETAMCWGANDHGQLGDNTKVTRGTPQPVLADANSPLTGIIDIAVGEDHSCAVLKDHSVKCWGANQFSQLGATVVGDQILPVGVNSVPAGTTRIVAGANHNCVLDGAGGLACWGTNLQHQLALNPADQAKSDLPVAIPGLTGLTLDELSAYGDFTCVHATTNGVWCWGANLEGENGHDLGPDVAQPTQLAGLVASHAVAGGQHGCAIGSDGNVVCWGSDALGQVGEHEYQDYGERRNVTGVTRATAIAAGANHTCALLDGGSVTCWGDNRDGELGTGISRTIAPVAPLLSCPK